MVPSLLYELIDHRWLWKNGIRIYLRILVSKIHYFYNKKKKNSSIFVLFYLTEKLSHCPQTFLHEMLKFDL